MISVLANKGDSVTITRVGTNEKYSDGWVGIFGGKASKSTAKAGSVATGKAINIKKSAAKKSAPAAKPVAPAAKPVVAKKSATPKAAKKVVAAKSAPAKAVTKPITEKTAVKKAAKKK